MKGFFRQWKQNWKEEMIARQVEREIREKKQKEYDDKWAKVILFPGTKEAYEDFKGYDNRTVEMINLGTTNQMIFVYDVSENNPLELPDSPKTKEELIDMGIEAILNHGSISYKGKNSAARIRFYGPAIRRKDFNDKKEEEK